MAQQTTVQKKGETVTRSKELVTRAKAKVARFVSRYGLKPFQEGKGRWDSEIRPAWSEPDDVKRRTKGRYSCGERIKISSIINQEGDKSLTVSREGSI
jgi:hypothetical protein